MRSPERMAREANTAIGSHGSPVKSPKLGKGLDGFINKNSDTLPHREIRWPQSCHT